MPQGAPRRAGERLPLVPRLQRLRQLAGERRLRPGRALLLLPAEADDLRRLPHAARRRRTIRAAMRTARCTPTASRRRTRRCALVNKDEEQMKITEDFLKSGFITVDIFAVSPIDETTERTPMVRRADGQAPQLMTASPSAKRRSSRGRSSFATSARWRRRSTRPSRCVAPAPRSASTWWCAPGRSVTSSRAAPWTRSTSGSSCRGTTPTDA